MKNLYYTPPPEISFAEVKSAAMELWKQVDSDNDRYGYATSKIDRIKDIKNVKDNFMYIVAMFDIHNQAKLASKLSAETRQEISLRLLVGGADPRYNPFTL